MRSQFCGSFMALMSRSWFTVILNWAPKTNAVPRRTNAVIVRVRDLGVIMGIIKPQIGCRHKAFGPLRSVVIHGKRIGFRLRRGGTSCFLSANPCLHVLPVRIVLGSKLPPSLVRVGEATGLRRQRHQQKQARER